MSKPAPVLVSLAKNISVATMKAETSPRIVTGVINGQPFQRSFSSEAAMNAWIAANSFPAIAPGPRLVAAPVASQFDDEITSLV